MTIDRDVALDLLNTLRANELALIARDYAAATAARESRVTYAELTLETIRAREWLQAELYDAAVIAAELAARRS